MTGASLEAPQPVRLSPGAIAGCVALLLLHAVLAWLIREPGITVRNDDALYVLLARSLGGGHFLDQHLQGAPPHALYPPGYPALLLLIGWLGGERLDLFLAANIVLSVASLALTFDLVRRHWSVATAFLVLGALVANNSLVRYAGSLVSEPAYLFLSTLVLWLLSRSRADARTLTLATVAAIAAGLTRNVGVVLLAAMVAWLLLERRYRAAFLVALAGGMVLGGWLLRVFLLPDEFRTVGRSYAEDVERMMDRGGRYFLFKRAKIGVVYATTHLPQSLPVPGVSQTGSSLAVWGWLLAALIPVGLIAWWRRRWRLGAMYVVGYLLLLGLWRMSSPRFLAVLLPLLVMALLIPFAEWGGTRWRRLGVGIAAVLTLLLGLRGFELWREDWVAIRGCDRSQPLGPSPCFNEDARAFFRLAERSAGVVPPEGVVLTAREATYAYYSGRTAWYLNTAFSPDSLDILPGLRQRGIGWVLLGHTHTSEPWALAPALAQDCDRLDLALEEAPRSALFRIRPESEGAGDGQACRALEAYRADSTPVPRSRK